MPPLLPAGASSSPGRAARRPRPSRRAAPRPRAGHGNESIGELLELRGAGLVPAMHDAPSKPGVRMFAPRSATRSRGTPRRDRGRQGLLRDRAHLRHVARDDRGHEVVLRREAAEDRPVADPRPPGDLVDARVGARLGEGLAAASSTRSRLRCASARSSVISWRTPVIVGPGLGLDPGHVPLPQEREEDDEARGDQDGSAPEGPVEAVHERPARTRVARMADGNRRSGSRAQARRRSAATC